jgi:hypothetical protein
MKPYGVVGVELESVGEAFALSEAIEFARDAVGPDDGYYTVLGQTALAVRALAETHQLTHGEESDAPFSLPFPEQMAADMARQVVRTGAEVHPDPLVRDALSEMQRSYETHVFNGAMGDGPPPEPPQYRSPFAE